MIRRVLGRMLKLEDVKCCLMDEKVYATMVKSVIMETIYTNTQEERKSVPREALRLALKLDQGVFEDRVNELIEKEILHEEGVQLSLTLKGAATIERDTINKCPVL